MKYKAFSIKISAAFLAFIFVTIAVYKSGLHFDFTYLDDQVQLVKNPNIRGLSFANLGAIFSSTSVGMYQPISTLFYALAFSIAGLNPFVFHLLSLVFHLTNTVLLYQILKKLHIQSTVGVLLCGIFALHPMQVESVVWLSAFSNLCFTFFFLLAFICYLNYSNHQKNKFYFLSLLFFLLACFAKSSAVIFPIILIAYEGIVLQKKWIKTSLSKIPFLIISFAFGVITIFSRESAGHLSDLSIQFSWFDRLFLISHSILFYPLKFFIPINLSAFYAYPEVTDGLLPISFYLSPLVLLVIGLFVWKLKPQKMVLFGLVFYLLGIALVLQFIPVGNQLTTDRYIYLPLLGFLLPIGYYLSQFKNQKLIQLAYAIPLLLALLSLERVPVWENDKTIWTDVISKNPNVAQAYNNLGSYVLQEKNSKLAMQHFNKAIALKPYYADAYSNRGSLYADLGNAAQAMKDFNQAIKLRPHADAYYNRANELVKQKDLSSAVSDYTASIKLNVSPDAFTNRAFAYAQMRKTTEALQDLNQALKLDPNYGQAYFLKGMIYNGEGNKQQACFELNKAAKLNHVKAKQVMQQICK